MSNDCGTVYPYRNPAKKDAEIVKLARAAGAIPIAVTNTPQLCMNWETFNNVIGITTNPYDQKRTTGGSSGGEVRNIASLFYLQEEEKNLTSLFLSVFVKF